MRRVLSTAVLAGLMLAGACSDSPNEPPTGADQPSALVTPGTVGITVRIPQPDPPGNWCLVKYYITTTATFGSPICFVTDWMSITGSESYVKFMWLQNGVVVHDPDNGKVLTAFAAGTRLYMSTWLPFSPTAGEWEVRLCETDYRGRTCSVRGSAPFTITQGVPDFVFDLSTLPPKNSGDPPFSVAGYVTTPSRGDITFATGDGSVGCTVTPGGMVTLSSPAMGDDYCIIEASQGPAPNYVAVGPFPQSFHIGQTVLTFAFDLSTLPAVTYGDPGFSVAGYVETNSTGAVTFATGSGSLGCSITTAGTVTILGGSGSGQCILEASLAADGTYDAAGPLSRGFPISAAILSVTARDATITFGETPTFGVDYSGFIGEDGASNLGGTLGYTFAGLAPTSYGPSATVPTDAGSYAITPGGINSADYGFTYTAGLLTINRAAGAVSLANIPADARYGNSFTPTHAAAGNGVTSTASSTLGVCTVADGKVSFVDSGTCTLVASIAEGTNHLAATGAPQSFTIGPAATNVVVRTRPSTIQYSDTLWFIMGTLGWERDGLSLLAEGTTGAIQFRIDGEDVGSPQPVANGGAALMPFVVTQAPGTRSITATFTSTNPRYASSVSDRAYLLTVTAEDARATYTGPEFVVTATAGATSANVPLSATIQDISAVDPGTDPRPGDIRNARVSFINRDNGQTLCADLVPVLVAGDDPTTGTVACTASLSVGSTGAEAYLIGIVVTGYYARDASDENTTVTVAQPIDGMITGGGHLVNSTSAGQYAGGVGLKTNFGFNVRYNKKLTNLQGGVNTIVRGADGKVYQIKSNATTSLSVNRPEPGMATFLARASLTDITDPLAPVSIGGNLDLQLTMRDNGNPGTDDVLAVTLRSASGALLFASSWNGTTAPAQNLQRGNLVVR